MAIFSGIARVLIAIWNFSELQHDVSSVILLMDQSLVDAAPAVVVEEEAQYSGWWGSGGGSTQPDIVG
jgi:hypothetical protein